MPDPAPFPIETIAAAVLHAFQDADAALAQSLGEERGGGYAIADLECEVRGFVSLSGTSISFLPAGSVPHERPETMSALRLSFARAPAGLRTPL